MIKAHNESLKKYKFLAILLVFVVTTAVNATNYYIDATNGNDNNNGTSPATAWQTISKINESVFSPGDSILFKKGEIWNVSLDFPSSGIAGNRITIGAYGTGAKPVITGMNPVDLNWTIHSGSIWKTNDIGLHPKRLLRDGIELLRAENMTELKTNPETFSWFYDNNSNVLYLYSAFHPDSSRISINTLYITVNISGISGKDYITIRDIEIRGGSRMGLFVRGNNIDVINITAGIK